MEKWSTKVKDSMGGFNFRLDTSNKRKKVVDQKKIPILKDEMEADVQF